MRRPPSSFPERHAGRRTAVYPMYPRTVALVASLVLSLCPTASWADDPDAQIDEISEQAQAAGTLVGGETVAEHVKARRQKPDILAVPLPISNPMLGAGIVAAGVAFYNPNNAPSPWISGGALMKTTNGNWLAAGFHSMSLDDDLYRISVAGGTGKIVSDYYGIGADAGDRDVSVNLDERLTMVRIQGQRRVSHQFYAGARFMFLDIDATEQDIDPAYPDLSIPEEQRKSRFVQLGPALTFDSRDDSLTPGGGMYAHAEWLFGMGLLGGDFSSNRFTARANWYLPEGNRRVWALHAGICGASSNSPYYNLCLYGQGNDLRGYETGRYRDRASWAMQAELRQKISGRWGAVAFAGIGGIAPSVSDLDDTRLLPSAGAGIRFRPSRKTNINLRLDVAFGRDSKGLYLGIAEAF